MVETQFAIKLQTLKRDNGGEHVSREMKSFLAARGIVSSPTTPHNPHQNGVVEGLNRTICNFIRSITNFLKHFG